MSGITKTKPMKEMSYRESRTARALGDPAKYAIVEILLKQGATNVNDIARLVHRSQPTVSYHLTRLKSLELVRFETRGGCVLYWIKYPEELKAIFQALSAFVKRAQHGLTSAT